MTGLVTSVIASDIPSAKPYWYFDEAAAEMKDAQYAGTIGPTGIFQPGDAGPNPERPMSANNVGDLNVCSVLGLLFMLLPAMAANTTGKMVGAFESDMVLARRDFDHVQLLGEMSK